MNYRGYNRNQSNAPDMIPSPYNFVPLSDKIVFPEWSEQISHDVPFSDGLSGTLEITITAESDLFVGGEILKDNNDRDIRYFFKANGKYYIPGTSIKGMIRNVLEIASFGKMSRVDDGRYSYRDLKNADYTQRMTTVQSNGAFRSNVKAGWLTQGGEGICIIPSEYARVEASDLTEIKRNVDLGKKQTSMNKYKQWEDKLSIKFNLSDNDTHVHSKGKRLVYSKAIALDKGNINGTIVFTGQPTDSNIVNSSKHMEFIFYDENKNNTIEISEKLFKEFQFIHSTDGIEPNEEWKYWRNKLRNKQRVPVFYLTDSDNKIESFGLAMMYRLPYDYSVHDLIKNTSKNTSEKHLNPENDKDYKADLADAIFGYTNKARSLKGRVHFGHLIGDNIVESNANYEKVILGTPKPTYYPNYIEQGVLKNKNDYKTFNTKDAKIRGWKRYPVEIADKNNVKPIDENKFKKVLTKFKPLKEGSTFKGKIRYHNLRPIELGALLWALNFGGDRKCKHKIGLAKPYGLGIISVEVKAENLDQRKYWEEFEKYVAEKLSIDYRNSEQIKELLAMADETQTSECGYEYPELQPKNHFVAFVSNAIALEKYSEAMKKVQSQNPQTNQPAAVKRTTEVDPVEKAVEGIVKGKDSSSNKEFNKHIKTIIEAGSLTEEQYATVERILRPKKRGFQIGDVVEERIKLIESIKPLVKKEG
jgi:CRISPR-associated protein (TIGR03986 family)